MTEALDPPRTGNFIKVVFCLLPTSRPVRRGAPPLLRHEHAALVTAVSKPLAMRKYVQSHLFRNERPTC